jgi:iron complex outermembrane receptor protein
VNVGGGTVERSNEAFRYGGKIGDDCNYRVYGKYFDRGPFYDPNQPANDAWNQGRFGFRADWDLDKADSLTVQGDHYVGTSGLNSTQTLLTPPYEVPLEGAVRNTGENVLARYRHVYDENSDFTMQTYFDNFERVSTVLNSELVKTFDLELQYRFLLTERQQITCGAGYRYIQENCPSVDPFTACNLPMDQNTYVVNQFIQDEIGLVPDEWELILGCKLEQNPYTNFEYEPTARLMWTPDKRHTLWGAVSRAVRTPAVIDRDLFYTGPPVFDTCFLRLRGNEAFQSESEMAYEIGYRTQVTEKFSWDIATFYNVYDDIRGQVTYPPQMEFWPLPPHLILPNVFANNKGVDSCGVELNANWSVSERWRLSAYYTFLHMNEYGHITSTQMGIAGQSPCNQVNFRSSWDLRKDLDFDLTARYVDSLPAFSVPSYITMDLRLAWRPQKKLELAVVGQNLLQAYHYEFGDSPQALGREVTEVPRGVYGTLTWQH